jgi:hypothetical protein
MALAGTLFLVPISCAKAVVTEGSGARTDWCDGILGFRTPIFTFSEPGILFAAVAVTGILFIEALRRSFRIRSRQDGR